MRVRAGRPARTGRRHRERSRPRRAGPESRGWPTTTSHRPSGRQCQLALGAGAPVELDRPPQDSRRLAAPRRHRGPAAYRPVPCRSEASRPARRRRSASSPAASPARLVPGQADRRSSSDDQNRARWSAATRETDRKQAVDRTTPHRKVSMSGPTRSACRLIGRPRVIILRPRAARRRTGCFRGGRCGARGRRRRRIRPSIRPSPRTRRCTAGRRGCR